MDSLNQAIALLNGKIAINPKATDLAQIADLLLAARHAFENVECVTSAPKPIPTDKK
jgi:hypothetical protein